VSPNQIIVSIIIPFFNAERYLEQTIKSALNQTIFDKEIILINDGSTDSSLSIAQSFANSTIKIISQDNKGAAAARNLGIKYSSGKYIQFLDADDILSPNKIDSQIDFLEKNEGKIAVCKTLHFWDGDDYLNTHIDHGKEWYFADFDDPVDFLTKLYGVGPYGGMIQPNAWLTPKSIIEQSGGWNENLSLDDDGEFFCRVILCSKGVVFTENGLNYYRKFKIDKKSLSSISTQKAYESALLSLDLKSKMILDRFNTESVRLNFARHYWEIAVSSYPIHKEISSKAERSGKTLGIAKYKPVLGGKWKNLIQKAIGWKLTKILDNIYK
jgi:glycosyltransferase involved in cell wall biosynthesis